MNQSAAYFYKQMPTLCSSRKYPYPRQGDGHWKFRRGRGRGGGGGGGGGGGMGVISITQVFKENMKLYWKFQGVGGSKAKNHPWGRYGSYLEPHILIILPLNY